MTGLLSMSGCKASEQASGDAAGEVAPTPVLEPADEPEPPVPAKTVNEFYARGTPTFVLGTAGDDAADRGVAMQVDLIRSMVFSTAQVVTDTTISLDAGPSSWPANPVVYGGPHVNSLLAALELPFELSAGRLSIGGQTFEGEDHQLIAIVPASDRNPEFVLYAGTGTPGVAEINAVKHGGEAIVVIDAFGRRVTGSWTRGPDGLMAKLDEPARRIPWRRVEREVAGAKVRFAFPEQLAREDDEDALIDAMSRGITRAIERLEIADPVAIDVYVHPDRGSKKSLTGDGGDGHAVAMAHALHVIRNNPAAGGPLELLTAHEATHVLAFAAWGPVGSSLIGEGLAVYVAGQYGGVSLEQWAKRVEAPQAIEELLGAGFRVRAEAETYPIAGVLVAAAIEQVGLEQVRLHLYGATPDTWADACERAGFRNPLR